MQISNVLNLNGSYTLSTGIGINSNVYIMCLRTTDYAGVLRTDISGLETATFNNNVLTYLYIMNGTNTNGIILKPMIRLSSVTDETYEPYTGGQASPNPNNKLDVHTVTGDCEVEVVSKNLFDKDRKIRLVNISSISTALQHFKDTGEFALGYVDIPENNRIVSSSIYFTAFIPMQEGVTYTAYPRYDRVTNWNLVQVFNLDDNGNIISYSTRWFETPYTHTATSEEKYMLISMRNDSLYPVHEHAQVEISSTATTYTPHAHQTFPIGLTGKNLFDVNSITSGYELDVNTGNLSGNAQFYTSDYIEVKPNTSYFISSSVKSVGSSNWFYDENKTPLVKFSQVKGEVIVPNNAQIKYIRFNGLLTQLQNLMFILGHEDAPYVPYRPPIELCKIGSYKDRIFKNTRTLRSGRANPLFNADLDEGDWYKHAEIGKVILDGSESGWEVNTNGGVSNTYAYYKNFSQIKKDFTNAYCISDYFSYYSGTSYLPINQFTIGGVTTSKNGNVQFNVGDTENKLADFKILLSSNNVEFIFPLETPTYTKITDTTLIAQLEAYYNSSTYRNVTNIITAGDDLAPIAGIVYKKDLTTLFNRLDSLEARVDLLE